MNPNLSLARAVADAVLYEGYLLYPYRASSTKNQARWQFGVLGPVGAAEAGLGEESSMWTDCMVRDADDIVLGMHLRFLHLQRRTVARAEDGGFVDVDELVADGATTTSWDEAVPCEQELGDFDREALLAGVEIAVSVAPAEQIEEVLEAEQVAGRIIRGREPLWGRVTMRAQVEGEFLSLRIRVDNTTTDSIGSKQSTIARSYIGTHLLMTSTADFVSMVDPPVAVKSVVDAGERHRCWPVLAGPEGQRDVLLISPIILYDHPVVAPESSVALFDSTEIDEILTLRILTLTDEEKAEARRTDPRAAEIIDRCEAMSPHDMQMLHGTMRDPRSFGQAPSDLFAAPDFPEFSTPSPDAGSPWWDPEVDAQVRPDVDAIEVGGVRVARGSIVRIQPSAERRADAQDLFVAGLEARVTGIHFDVDGSTHVAVVMLDDPAADLHEWYGRFLYFAPDEIVPTGRIDASDSTNALPGRKVL